MKRVAVCLILAGVLVGVALLGVSYWFRSGEQPFQAEGLDAPVTPVAWQACGFEAPTGIHVRCGWFDTGEQSRGGDPIRLRLLMLRRTAEPPHAPLTIHIPGGPGAPAGTGREAAGDWAAWMLRHGFPGRLLLFDPRGTGASQPSLECPGRILASRDRLARPPDAESHNVGKYRRLRDCRARLIASGLDPADFAAHRMLADVPRMMRAMNVYRARLLGLSHGSRLGLALLRQSPERFSRAVLDGVFPTNRNPFAVQAELAADARTGLSSACRGPNDCADTVSSTALHILRSRVRKSPPLIFVPQPALPPQPLRLSERRLLDLVFAAQSFGATSESLRQAFQQAVVGDYNPLADLFAAPLAHTLRENRHEPVYWASLCAEAGKSVEQDLTDSHPCRNGWGHPGLPDAFRMPVATDHRVLLLAGQHDPVTPPVWASEQRDGMPRSHLLIEADSAHGTLFSGDCVGRAVAEFLGNRDTRLPAECPTPSGDSES